MENVEIVNDTMANVVVDEVNQPVSDELAAFLDAKRDEEIGKRIALKEKTIAQGKETVQHFTKLGPAKSYLKGKKVNAGLIDEVLQLSMRNPDPMSVAGVSNPMSDMIAPALLRRAPPGVQKFFKENYIYNLVMGNRDKESVLWITRPSRGDLYILSLKYIINGTRHTLPELLTIYLANYLYQNEDAITRLGSDAKNPL